MGETQGRRRRLKRSIDVVEKGAGRREEQPPENGQERQKVEVVVSRSRARRCLELEATEGAGPHESLLPFHLILGRLPVRQIFQLPCVCKHWNLMLGAGEVLLDSMTTVGEEYWFVMSKPTPPCGQRVWDFMAFSSLSLQKKDWAFFRLPLPSQSQSHSKLLSLLGGMSCTRLGMYHFPTEWTFHPCLVSAGGLMCAFVEKSGAPNDYHVIVFNVLTGSVKVLPPVLDRCYLFERELSLSLSYGKLRLPRIYMAFDDRDADRYYIMLTHEDTFSLPGYFELFDSRSGCWKVGQNPKKSATANLKAADGDFFHEDMFRSTLFAYHAADDVWSKLHVPNRKNEAFGLGPTFHKYNGRLLRGLLLKKPSYMKRICLGFVVFELQPATSEAATWVEVARTPPHLWQGLVNNWMVLVKAEGSLFYLEMENSLVRGQFRPPLVYDLTQNSWYVLPSGRGSSNYGCFLVHRPRLSMRMPYLTDGNESNEAISPSHGM